MSKYSKDDFDAGVSLYERLREAASSWIEVGLQYRDGELDFNGSEMERGFLETLSQDADDIH